MLHVRPMIALGARSFGRGPNWIVPVAGKRAGISDELKLFVTTFIAGFVFVSVLLA